MVKFNLRDVEEIEEVAEAELERLAKQNIRNRMNAAARREATREMDRRLGRRNGGRKP